MRIGYTKMILWVLCISLVSSCPRSPDTRIVNLDEGGYLHHILDYDDYYDDTSNQELLVPASNKIETSEGKSFVIYQAIDISIFPYNYNFRLD